MELASIVPQTGAAVLTEPCNFAEKALIWVKFISSPSRLGDGRGLLRGLKMLQFAGYTLDIARNSLRSADRKVALRRKSFELLHYFAENPDRLVTKEELLKAIWPDVAVTEESLTHCVSEVRHAIGDSAQTIIETVPRRGYRFTAPVLRVASGAVAPGTAGVSPALPRRAGETPAVPGGEAAPPASPDAGSRSQSPSLDRPSVAVLPFANLSGDPQQDYFSDGITEDITTELSRFSELRVIARNSAFQYKGKAVDVRHVGRELNARYVLEGSCGRRRDRIRITAQLVDSVTGTHRWAERYDRDLVDVFAVQDEVVRAIVAILAAHLNRAEIERVLLKPPAAWEAYDYYLRGAEAFLLHVNRRTKASLYEARRLLDQSLAIDPLYARGAVPDLRLRLSRTIRWRSSQSRCA